jgi:S-adenosylmethionine:tRNA ribosyltransferase-isomerase
VNNKNINISHYNYHLPEEKIAFFPCENRDGSKLLIYKNGIISESVFKHITDYLDDDCMLVFNNTEVIHARISCFKPTGSRIEIFCLEPILPSLLHALAFEAKGSCRWKCFIGNNKRFTESLSIQFNHKGEKGVLQAEKLEAYNDASYLIQFSWTPQNLSFAEVLDSVGKIPLPPYIKRDAEEFDNERYQTVFAKEKGSVAAPTAGLHFTAEVLEKIKQKNIPTASITLHVGAGTFKPVTETCIENHIMHREHLFFTKETIINLLENSDKKIIAVGTTTARALESLYWTGVRLLNVIMSGATPNDSVLHLAQWQAYTICDAGKLTVAQSLEMVLRYMSKHNLDVLHASTAMMIMPYYQRRMVKGIITNFHQPKSTLLLLISSFTGNKWKKIYDYALAHDFRFLSYGDACLFC